MKSDRRKRNTGTFRRVVGDILIILAVYLLASVLVTMIGRMNAVVLKGDYQEVFRYQLLLCGILLLFSLDVRFGLFTRPTPKAMKALGWLLRAVVTVFSAVIIAFGGKVTIGGMIASQGSADHAIVLGMALENGQAAPDLIRRLDTARRYYEEHPDSTLILTGGNAEGSTRSEADVMHDLLLERGIPENRIRLEDQSSDTRENFRNAARFLEPSQPVVLITSNYHMDRAVRIAQGVGFKNCLRLPAPSSFLAYGSNVMSEIVLNVNDLIRKR